MNHEEIYKKLEELNKKLDNLPLKKPKRVITKPPTEKQLLQREKFKQMMQSKKKPIETNEVPKKEEPKKRTKKLKP